MEARAEDIDSFQRAFGEALIAAGKLDKSGLDRAFRLANGRGENLANVLAKLGLVNERDLAATLAAQLNAPLVEPIHLPDTPLAIAQLSPKFLRQRRILPLARTEAGYVLAMADPLDAYALDAFRLATGETPVICVAEPGLIERAIDRLYGERLGGAADPSAALEAEEAEDIDVERLKDLASEAPVIQLVNSLISRAVEARASDIHIEPFENEFRVRYRVDGVLQDSTALPDRLRSAVISRIKIMARLDIAERRLPQDGRVKMIVRGKSIDLRISTLPIMHGESVVMRVLDRDSVELDFNTLGVRDPARSRLNEILAEPNGIFLVTGPTGSGKTTTLYAALCAINSPEKKVLTVEDPIEYQLDGVNQVQVKPGIGLSFASVLRSMLRQDPDIIMVGEIRDGETARIAAQAALTGHLVLSTLHTNDAASAVTRLIDMGVEDYLLTSTLTGIAAQRLVRRLCQRCREPYPAMTEIVEQFGLRQHHPDGEITLYRPRGCDACGGRGYLGRTVVMEALKMTDRLRALVLRQAEAKELQRAAVEEGMRTMFEDGVTKALDGITTLEEVMRTTRDI
jgi:general secretion pathway protein E